MRTRSFGMSTATTRQSNRAEVGYPSLCLIHQPVLIGERPATRRASSTAGIPARHISPT